MKLSKLVTAVALTVTAFSSFADTSTTALDLSTGSTFFGRTPVGTFTDTYTFSILSASNLVNGSGTTSAIGDQDLDFTSLTLQTSAGVTLGTFVPLAGNTDANEDYKLPIMSLAAGSYKLVISGVNSPAAASYSGTFAVTPVPEPETYALMLAGLGAIGFVARRRRSS